MYFTPSSGTRSRAYLLLSVSTVFIQFGPTPQTDVILLVWATGILAESIRRFIAITPRAPASQEAKFPHDGAPTLARAVAN